MSGLRDVQDYYRRLPEEKYGILSKVSHQHNILDVLYGGTGVQNPSPAWTYEISPPLLPVDQQHTGRCWIFSTLEVFNHMFRNQYGIRNSKATFSEAYIGFWDLFEKARFFLQVALDTRDEDLEQNTSVAEFFKTGIQDGGDYIFATNIMEKYGIVPSEFFPNRTYGTASTESTLTVLNQILRDNASTLRRTGDKRKIKPMMHNVFAILILSFGKPPEPWSKLNWCIEQNEDYSYYAASLSPAPPLTSSSERVGEEGGEGGNSTVKIEEELEEELGSDDLKLVDRAEREKVTIVAPPDISDSCEVRGKCGNAFDKFLAGLVRPPPCTKETDDCGARRLVEGCPGLQRLAYKKKGGRRETDKNLVFNYTPVQFYDKFIAPSKFVPLLSDPRYPDDSFIVLNDTNMLNGKEGKYFNVSIDQMTEYAIASIKMNIPVFFAADVKKEITPEGGKLAPDDDSLERLLPEVHDTPSKKEKIKIYNAMATHAMVLTGVSMSHMSDVPEWWRVVNSWGEAGARCGIYILSHKWFKRHVYSINVPLTLLSKKHRTLFKTRKDQRYIYMDGSEANII